ncbi:uncharacterized protein EI90DRAFT_3149332 [Cantharellus anzutake]|uniref:uncharacterized protein n=1 Tax=Cantharellus anzutake TaxID=1750568 RepID=UPI001903840B|nr:uncharacterized protein EI90DRAFT_3149332 [Cantharellus anzutake]KAF8343765.1 hypothetical protein EI90DRAFT_3149332 [Cantharellus anzutake]
MNTVQSGKRQVYYVSNPDPGYPTIGSPSPVPLAQPIRRLPSITAPYVKALPIPGQPPSAPSFKVSSPAVPPHPHDSPSSPETSDASSTVSAITRNDTLIMVTKNNSGLGFFPLDLVVGDDGYFIRERILGTLKIPDEDRDNAAIYRTELRDSKPLGWALTNEDLLEICEKEGDNRGILHFLIDFSPAPSSEYTVPRNKSTELLDSYSTDDYTGYLASDEGTGRTPNVVPAKLPPRDISYSPPAVNSNRINNVAPFPRSNLPMTSPSKPPRALPQPAASSQVRNTSSHSRSGSDQAAAQGATGNSLGQWSASEKLVSRSPSSLGFNVSDGRPSLASGVPAPPDTNVWPPPRSDSIETASPFQAGLSNAASSTAQITSPVLSPITPYHRRPTPTVPPPRPPADAEPFQLPAHVQNPPPLSLGNQGNDSGVANGASMSTQASTPLWYTPASGGGASPYGMLNGVTGSVPPHAGQGQRLLSPRNPSSPRQLVGARSSGDLRMVRGPLSRALPIGPKATPSPIQTSGLALQTGLGMYTQTPSTTTGSPALSPVMQPPVSGIAGTRRQADPRRREQGYQKRSGVSDAPLEGSATRAPGVGLTRSPAMTAARVASRSGASSRPAAAPPPSFPPPPPPSGVPPRLKVQIPQGLMSPILSRPSRQDGDRVPTPVSLGEEQRNVPGASHDSNSTPGTSSSSHRDWPSTTSGGLGLGLEDVSTLISTKHTSATRQSSISGASTIVPSTVIPTKLTKPTSYLDTDSDSSDSDSDSDSDPGTLLIPIIKLPERPATSTPTPPPQSAPGLNVRKGHKSKLSPLRTNFKRDDAWLVRPPPEQVYERLDQFFPDHNLDEPMIDASSPTESSEGQPIGVHDSMDGLLNSSARERHRKSIRVVVDERKNKIKQLRQTISRGFTKEQKKDNQVALLRRRSTKLWGSRLEELRIHAPLEQMPPVPSLPEFTQLKGKKEIDADGNGSRDENQQRHNWKEENEKENDGGKEQGQASSVNINKISGLTSRRSVTFKWIRGELIGRGTYGRVYLALNATAGEMIAVKQVELPKTVSDKEDARQVSVVEALRSEGSTLRTLDHPNIVQYLGIQETEQHLSIFLEYIPGGSIGSCLRKYGRFSEDVIKAFTRDILEGLSYLHSVGVLHRDLKADNILVDPSGTCKISDFGISKKAGDIYKNETNTAMMGSIFWMAPEVLTNNQQGYSAKIDIWSLGCVVLEMWAGRRPWNQEDMITVMYKLGSTKQAPPVPDDVTLGEFAEDFRSKCFAVDPAQRPMAAELCVHPYLILPRRWKFPGFPQKESPST